MLDFLLIKAGVDRCELMVTGLGALSDGSMTVADAKLAPKTQVMVISQELNIDSDE